MCYFLAVRVISTFKRSFHTILHAEFSAHHLQRRNIGSISQNAIFRRFWRKVSVITILFEALRRLDSFVTQLYNPNVVHDACSVEQALQLTKHNVSWNFTKTKCYIGPVWNNSTFKGCFHSILHAICGARIFQRQDMHSSSQIGIIPRFSRKLSVISFLYEIFRRLNGRFTPFYTPNVVHATFTVETSTAACKTQSFADLHEN